MFDSANLDHVVDEETYRREEPKLREALLAAQVALGRQARFPVLIVIGGVEGAGKSETVNVLNEWMDPRHIRTYGFPDPSDEERERPRMWRFWRHLPRRGRFVLFDRSWYGRVLVERVEGLCAERDWMRAYGEINDFEQAMVAHGLVVAKFWLAISKQEPIEGAGPPPWNLSHWALPDVTCRAPASSS